MVDAYPVPGYLPAPARTVLPWAKRKVAHLAAASRVPLADLWDEVITALLRADLTFRPGAGSYTKYAQTCITRGLWRYSLPNTATTQTPGSPKKRGIRKNGSHPENVSLTDIEEPPNYDVSRGGTFTKRPFTPNAFTNLVSLSPPTPEDWLIAAESVAAHVPPKDPHRLPIPHPAQHPRRYRML